MREIMRGISQGESCVCPSQCTARKSPAYLIRRETTVLSGWLVSPANIFSSSKSPLSFSLCPPRASLFSAFHHLLSPPFRSYTSYLTTVSSITPADPLLSRSARIRSPKIIRNRFETRPFESWRSWRRSWGCRDRGREGDEAKRKVQRFLLPLTSVFHPFGMRFFLLDAARRGGFIQLFYNLGSSTRRVATLFLVETPSLPFFSLFIVFFACAIS